MQGVRRRQVLVGVGIGLSALVAAVGVPSISAAQSRPRSRAPRARHGCVVPGAGRPLARVWRPDLRAAIAYARSRQGDIAFAVRTDTTFAGYRPDHQEWSASVLKAMLTVAYLNRPSVARRWLDADDRSLLGPMITQSSNAAADDVDPHAYGKPTLKALFGRRSRYH